ncbi:MAG: hypothetical protein WC784_05035 [Candidatus Shapirobacteria bacterium]|jgi:hypothetical protein
MGMSLIERAKKGRVIVSGFDTRIRNANTANEELRRAEKNLKTLGSLYLIGLLDQTKDEIFKISPDVQLTHNNDWSEVNLSWDFEEHVGDEGKYTVGKGIFVTTKEDRIEIGYSGTEIKAKLATPLNVRDLVYNARREAILPDFSCFF